MAYFCSIMKKITIVLLAWVFSLQLHAQTDSLTAPVSVVPQRWALPYYYGLHQGLNVSLSASVIAGFGKYAPKGAGFAQNLHATYLTSLSPKLSLMVGGYVNNLNWGGINTRNAGIYGELSYQFDEHWEAHVYGQKNLAGNTGFISGLYGGYGLWPMGLAGGSPLYGGYLGGVDRLGAGFRYNFDPSFSVEVNFEQVWYPNHRNTPYMGGIHDQVNTFNTQHGMPTKN